MNILNKSMDDVFELIKEGSNMANKNAENGKVDIRNATLKVMEESGELAAEVLKYIGHKITDESKEKTMEKLKSEGVDTLLAVFDVLNIAGIQKEEILNLSNKAIEKWKQKHIFPKQK